ncbi:MAG: alpha/beta hydrolase-fold protein, partial [Planctomycetota bacterium]|nr:alpha/beta hydrolase-fold protein [Planctomycetota bacterium]
MAAEPAPAPAAAPVAPAPGKQPQAPLGEWLDPDHSAPNGTQYKTFSSKVLGRDVSYLLYLPPEYEQQQNKRYPVIYWLHGRGGNQRAGATVYIPHLDAAVKQGSLPPVIVVLVNGMGRGHYLDSQNGQLPIESVIVKDLVPHID